ncbi:MAG: altronate hydrolase [Promethearchaeota archaeon]|nr:MAG: altronate hydrolase [Candidatus Lokiarchaeota archaeon]
MGIKNEGFILMSPKDNCATALENISKEQEININDKIITINQEIPMGHKFAVKDIHEGDIIKKYGEIIGIATKDIKMGDWIHTHNIRSHYLEVIDK